MKKRSLTLLVASAVAGSVLFSSCIGSFGLTNKLLTWNKSIDSKFVNELVFLALWIVPVYEISAAADVLILNSIEFWSGNNPVADAGTVKTVDTVNGTYTVETRVNGYHIQKAGEQQAIDLVFDKMEKSWSIAAGGEARKLMKFDAEDKVVMFLPDGKEMNVDLNQAGVLAFRQIVDGYSYYAAR